MPTVALGLALVVFGAASLQDGYRIVSTLRTNGTFDLIGPDYYLIVVGALLIVMGAIMLVPAVSQLRLSRNVVASVSSEDQKHFGVRHFWLFGALCVYVSLMPFFGYALATLVVFVVIFWLMGVETWPRSAIASVIMTAIFVPTFEIFADMPFPPGFLNFIR